MKSVVIFSDGACRGNPGPGGWAAVLLSGTHRKEISGFDPATTNNRMELQGALAALACLKNPCQVDFHTDSKYVQNGISAWIHQWRRNGWRTQNKLPVKNADLWKELDQQARRHTIQWHWLKGHAGHAENERCDQLANAAIDTLLRECSPEALQQALRQFQNTTAPPETQNSLF